MDIMKAISSITNADVKRAESAIDFLKSNEMAEIQLNMMAYDDLV